MKTTLILLKVMALLMFALLCFSAFCFFHYKEPTFLFWMIVQAGGVILSAMTIWNSADLLEIEKSMP